MNSYLLSADEMRALDRAAMDIKGVPGLLLMENAGRGCAEQILSNFSPSIIKKGVTIVAGPGNNGGDGFVIARHLLNHGYRCRIISLAPAKKFKGDAEKNLQIILKHHVPIHFSVSEQDIPSTEKMLSDSSWAGLIVDAIFGTGLTRKICGRFAETVKIINNSPAKVMSVDIPSGISSDTGQVLGAAVMADLTVTMAMAKRGHFLFPGRSHTGKLEVVNIGITRELIENANLNTTLFTQDDFMTLIKKRPENGHKGTFGHLLTIVGSRGKSGAAALVSAGALRAGSGLVTAAVPASVQTVLARSFFEHMTEPLPETSDGTVSTDAFDAIMKLIERKKVVVAGPGLGLHNETVKLCKKLVAKLPLPLVADADMLTAIGDDHALLLNAPAPRILLPHPGEMSRLTGYSVAEIEANRIEVAQEFAIKTGCYLALKGAGTVCASPHGAVSVNTTGNPGMGAGGMGDVLAGVTGGLAAQGYSPWDALRLAVFAHGRAGDILYRIRGNSPGFLASEVAEKIRVNMS